MKYYIIAGEASGDLHASNLMKEIKALDSQVAFRIWGGDLMKAQGAELVKHIRDISFMGFVEVVANLRTIIKNIRFCKKDLLDYKPDALILVDYPGFNLRIAEFAHKNNIKVFYYISPQVWAWKQKRVHKIKKWVDRMFVILPFEKDFYKKFNYDVDFVGHPLLDAIENYKNSSGNYSSDLILKASGKPIIALLPGSRKQEISKMLEIMLKVIPSFPGYYFVIAGSSNISKDFYDKITEGYKIPVISGRTYNILSVATAALVTSGTATLETALFEVPEVVCYKGSPISFAIAKRIVNIKYISLVNLISDKLVVKELIQNDLTPENLVTELNLIFENIDYLNDMHKNYKELKKLLGGSGASRNTAERIFSYLQN